MFFESWQVMGSEKVARVAPRTRSILNCLCFESSTTDENMAQLDNSSVALFSL